MNNKALVIIDNEKVFKENNFFYCDNIDTKSISEELSKLNKVSIITRRSKIKRVQKINLSDVKTGANIFKFVNLVLKTFKIKNTSYLLISINPYTFFSFIFLLLFRKKIFVYLRSSGHEEYKSKYGIFGTLVYHIMFLIVTKNSNLIICNERLSKKKNYHLVFPSQLDDSWFENHKEVLLNKIRLLYVGRMRVEKGIFQFLKMFDKINSNVELSIVSENINLKNINKRINLLGFGYDTKSLIEIYDNHNIFILPSFTEAHPQVVLESLSRKRPVIIFEEIDHIVGKKKGIFVSKRNEESFLKTVEHIMENYMSIQASMESNYLPTKKEFISHMSNILG